MKSFRTFFGLVFGWPFDRQRTETPKAPHSFEVRGGSDPAPSSTFHVKWVPTPPASYMSLLSGELGVWSTLPTNLLDPSPQIIPPLYPHCPPREKMYMYVCICACVCIVYVYVHVYVHVYVNVYVCV